MTVPPESCHDGFRRERVWSLWDMINYQVFGLVGWLGLVEQERRISREKSDALLAVGQMEQSEAEKIPQAAYLMTDQDKSRLEGLLAYAGQLCKQLDLIRTEDRVVRFRQAMRPSPLSPVTVHQELKTLHEALQDDLHLKYFYFYPDKKAQRLLRVSAEWALAFEKFKSIKQDAAEAADCYALGHNNACIYQCMRVLERGIAALAADVGLTFNTQQWKNILDDIETKIEKIRENGIPGTSKADKDARLQFLSEAAKEFFYFKDGWRNYASHNKVNYDEHQALGALEHTRAFMNHLASQLSEGP